MSAECGLEIFSWGRQRAAGMRLDWQLYELSLVFTQVKGWSLCRKCRSSTL